MLKSNKFRTILGICLIIASIACLSLSPVIVTAATSYYVDGTSGNDNNNGTSTGSAFKTIQKAASVAVAGDTVYIRGGTYFESVRPTNSGASGNPITFRNYNGESVTVSAGDPVTGWTLDSGNVYYAACNWDMGQGFNQVVVDGDLMIEGRYPNITDKNGMISATYDNKTFNCTAYENRVESTALNQATDYWKGGIFWGKCGLAWSAQSATITSSSSGRINIDNKTDTWWWSFDSPGVSYLRDKNGAGSGFITGCRNAIDVEKEWFLDTTNHRLYLYAPGGGNPSGKTVYVKKRNTVFDLSARNYIIIDGVNSMMGGIDMDDATNCQVKNGSHRYSSHFYFFEDGRGDFPFGGTDSTDIRGAGIFVSGENNVISACQIEYCAGAGVRMEGRNNTLSNSVMHDTGYAGAYVSGVYIDFHDSYGGQIGGHSIVNNTIYRSGRGAVQWNASADTSQMTTYNACSVKNNDIYDYRYLTMDGGAIYCWNVNGSGTELANNWIHGGMSFSPSGTDAGIYLDNMSANFKVHHNVIFDEYDGICLNLTAINHEVYNNTLWVAKNAMRQWGPDGTTMTNCKVYNNFSNFGSFIGTDQQNNLQSLKPNFAGYGNGGLYFKLNASSPAKDMGRVITGITDGYAGSAPDVGAYENGGTAWTAGSSLAPASPGIRGPYYDSIIASPKTTATASSVVNSSWPATNAIDANTSTAWSSSVQSQTGSQWLQVDMGSNFNVKKVILIPRTSGSLVQCFPVDFKLQYSTDGSSWTDVPGQAYTNYPAPVNNSGENFYFDSPVYARYIRLLATKFSPDGYGNYYTQIAEMAPYYTYVQTPRSSATSSTQAGAGMSAAKAVDSDTVSFWSSAATPQTGYEWVYTDMGGTYNVRRITILPRLVNGIAQCFPVDFSLSYSNDGVNWTQIPGQSYTNYPSPALGTGESFVLATPVNCKYIGIGVTKFSKDAYQTYYSQLAELIPQY